MAKQRKVKHSDTRQVVFLRADSGDWEAMYIDGKLVRQDHNLDYWRVLDALGINYETREVEVDEYDTRSAFPEKLPT